MTTGCECRVSMLGACQCGACWANGIILGIRLREWAGERVVCCGCQQWDESSDIYGTYCEHPSLRLLLDSSACIPLSSWVCSMATHIFGTGQDHGPRPDWKSHHAMKFALDRPLLILFMAVTSLSARAAAFLALLASLYSLLLSFLWSPFSHTCCDRPGRYVSSIPPALSTSTAPSKNSQGHRGR
jgi:hypothetical protein